MTFVIEENDCFEEQLDIVNNDVRGFIVALVKFISKPGVEKPALFAELQNMEKLSRQILHQIKLRQERLQIMADPSFSLSKLEDIVFSLPQPPSNPPPQRTPASKSKLKDIVFSLPQSPFNPPSPSVQPQPVASSTPQKNPPPQRTPTSQRTSTPQRTPTPQRTSTPQKTPTSMSLLENISVPWSQSQSNPNPSLPQQSQPLSSSTPRKNPSPQKTSTSQKSSSSQNAELNTELRMTRQTLQNVNERLSNVQEKVASQPN